MRLRTRNAYQSQVYVLLGLLKAVEEDFSLSSTEEYLVINMDHF